MTAGGGAWNRARMASTAPSPGLGARLRAVVPWALAILLLGYVIRPFLAEADKRAVLADAFGRAGFATFAVTPLLFLFIMTADSLAIWRTFGWFGVRLRYAEALLIRGSTYLLALVNYSVGQGGIIYFVHRERQVPVARAIGIVLFIMGINLVTLLVMVSGGMLATAVDERIRPLRAIVLALCLAFPCYLGVIAWRPAFVAARAVLAPLFEAHLRGHLHGVLVRIPHIASLMLAHYVVFRLFGVDPPIGVYIRDQPVVFLLAVLPITVQGLGTTQVAQIYFFAPYAPGANRIEQEAVIIASSLFWTACGFALQAVTGAICLRLGGRRMLEAAGQIEPARPAG